MLNPFPDLLIYSALAPFILRVIVGLIFLDLGYLMFKGEKTNWLNSFQILRIKNPLLMIKIIGVVEIIGGLMLLAGAYTQIAALILGILTFSETYIEYQNPNILKRGLAFYVLILSILLSLLLSGAGAFAFDLPL
jgi:uncharacterized membrane protein YphA (DoxX/SURF4 family)